MSAEDKEGTHFEASLRTGGWAFKEDDAHRKVVRRLPQAAEQQMLLLWGRL
jgi:hypothetical protein